LYDRPSGPGALFMFLEPRKRDMSALPQRCRGKGSGGISGTGEWSVSSGKLVVPRRVALSEAAVTMSPAYLLLIPDSGISIRRPSLCLTESILIYFSSLKANTVVLEESAPEDKLSASGPSLMRFLGAFGEMGEARLQHTPGKVTTAKR